MAGIRTVALIERKTDITRDLFSRYWRDVHGVMAARIPGFARYTQYHVTPKKGHETGKNFEGIALVSFATEEARGGLANSAVTRHIHRDEQNVFRRALLYNLAEGAYVSGGLGTDMAEMTQRFYVLPSGQDAQQFQHILRSAGCACQDIYDLRTGDPSAWNETDASDGGDGETFIALVHAGWQDMAKADKAEQGIGEHIGIYHLDNSYVMVDDGFPTAIGLRGLDAVRTIMEADAVNQLAAEVVEDIYGAGLVPVEQRA
ncbi:MAG: EthD domain-containing protein [Parasphingorhabdus sp.]|uniref:EthD domain-containing protein n=1 Tax=Parasphingorhabdus sp. TaxID=2709688 RepID=UPI0030022AF0